MKTRNLLLLGAAILLVGSAAYVMPTAPRTAPAQAADPWAPVGRANPVPQSSAELLSYWTPERMASAAPMGAVLDGPSNPVEASTAPRESSAGPVFVDGNAPGEAPGAMRAPQLADGPLPSPNLNNNTPPTWYPYPPPFTTSFIAAGWPQLYPLRTHGKLYFTRGGLDFTCSGTSVTSGSGGTRRLAWTAGHCVHDGLGIGGGYSGNLLFCPAYVAGHAGPWGCWGWLSEWTTNEWHDNANYKWDYGVVVTSNTSSLGFGRLGDVLGTQGITADYDQPAEFWSFGYPVLSPYNGNALVWTTAGEATWDNPNVAWAGDPTIGSGSDQTGGSSGGGWLIGARLGATGFLAGNNSYKYAGEDLEMYSPFFNAATLSFWNIVRLENP